METTNNAVVVKPEEKVMTYVPFGSKEEIKLSASIIRNFIAVPTKSGKLPSERDCIRFLMMCKARLLNPFEGDAYLIGYDSDEGPTFSLITAHQAFLKRAELNPEYDGMKSGLILQEGDKMFDVEGDFYIAGKQKVLGGWATVHFKNRSVAMHKRIRIERFQKSFGIWKVDAAGMICKCAEADALRSAFPTMLGGLYLKEELIHNDAQNAINRPLFKTPATVEAVPPAIPVSTLPIHEEILEKFKNLGIIESQLMEFCVESGVVEEGLSGMKQAVEEHPNIADLLIEQAADIADRIKNIQPS